MQESYDLLSRVFYVIAYQESHQESYDLLSEVL